MDTFGEAGGFGDVGELFGGGGSGSGGGSDGDDENRMGGEAAIRRSPNG